MSPMSPRLLRPRAGGGFDPRSIAGLAGWWDFSDSSAANMTTSGGSPNAISFIADKSGSGRSLSQSDPARQPSLVSASMGGRSAASFSVDNLDAANFPSSTSITAFAVARRAVWTSAFNFMAGRGYAASSGMAVFGTLSSGYVGSSQTDEIQSVGNGFFTGTPRAPAAYGPWASAVNAAGGNIMSTVLSAAESGVWLNGTNITRVPLTGTDVNYATGTFALGNNGAGGDWSNYTVGEFLIFTSRLTAAERQRIEGYLAWKWGLQNWLSYNHPYYASFPGFGSQFAETEALARDSSGNAIPAVSYNEGGVNYTAHIFNTSGTIEFRRAVDVDYLIVAGGGGGGGNIGGGGGGGGVIVGQLPASAAQYAIAVGVGGSGQVFAESKGGNSSALSVTALGGGYGGTANGGITAAMSGGSGGGAGGTTTGVSYASGGTGTAGQGNAGGGHSSGFNGGGGGGATQVGGFASPSSTGVGGAGLSSAISGQSLVYGSGGGGCTHTAPTEGFGGDGGGLGGIFGSRVGGSAVNGRGGGGGGGGYNTFVNGATDGRGGSGAVIVRYKTAAAQPFLPNSIPNLALWLDSSDASTLGTTSAGPGGVSANTTSVRYWGDKSGTGRHAIHTGVGPVQPTYATTRGRHGLYFNNSYLINTAGSLNTANSTMFIVTSIEATQYMNLFSLMGTTGDDWNGPGGGICSLSSTTASSIYWGGTNFTGYSGTGTAMGIVNINVPASTGSASLWFRRSGVDNTQTSAFTPNAQPSAGFNIGSRWFRNNTPQQANPWVGMIAEILWYNTSLTTAQQSQVRTYLQNKWGV